MLGTVLHILYTLTYLILTTTRRGWNYYYPHFTAEETGAQEMRFELGSLVLILSP